MESMRFFTLKNKYFDLHAVSFVFLLVFVFGLYSPLGQFTASPKFWRDESIPFDIARTFAEMGTLDVGIAPNKAFDTPYMTHATGVPVTVPLAGVFVLFGVGVFQARVFMLMWIACMLLVAFFFIQAFFNRKSAFWGTALVGSFAPLYANGKTVTGEIPGFLFLLLALFFFYKKERFFLGGILLALAVITKPSIYILLLPAVACEFLFSKRMLGIKQGVRAALGAGIVFLGWIYLILPSPFLTESWSQMILFYRNAFNEASLWSRLPGAFAELAVNSTVWYTAFIFLCSLVAYYWSRGGVDARRWYAFSLWYFLFAVVYFLRSPGWFRYLVAAQLLFLLGLYPALESFADALRLGRRKTILVVSCILLANVIVYFFFSNIPSGTRSLEVGNYINHELLADKSSTVGILYDSPIAALIPTSQKFQIGTIGGDNTYYGKHPLSYPENEWPDYLYIGGMKNDEYESVVRSAYEQFGPYPNIFKRKKN